MSAYVKLESPEQIEPGDIVYEVVRFGTREEDVKYNELRVTRVERQAVQVVKLNGARGTRPIKMAFHSIMIRPRECGPVVRRLAAVAAPAIVAAPPVPRASESFGAYVELTTGILEEARAELRGLDDARDSVRERFEVIEKAHRKRVEELERELANVREVYERDRQLASVAMESVGGRRVAVEGRVAALEAMLKAVGK